ncbi:MULTISPECIES: snapalysin [Streptomyces]|nr:MULTISPECIES: snapalysin [Streptomyces]AVH95512.1 ABC transporter substrate-binding protein [Streptomyces sp. WAC00288]KYG54195.1 ABC transporter substrate-binding protein [Streptomyces sp. WAC04657]MBB4158690.1 snapalysin [Streptomyces cinereoruber]MBY8814640.1 snapalysin [Streptomyces cinereoruber]NIH59351.1 snapalysin [Streptomyces cinereoruber]
MRHPKVLNAALTAVLGLGLAASLGAAPAAAAPDDRPVSARGAAVAYAGSAEEARANQAFFDAVVESVAKKRAAAPGAAAVTVVYNAANAPSFRTQIARSTQIWNSSVVNVRLVEGSNPDFRYYEGNDSRGSYASTDGHGRGYIFLDYRQNQQYDSTRVTTHETGHVLGLPDHYSGPCSELMSGGGPGTSCRNAQPNAQERARVDQLWRYGLASAFKD